MYLRTKTPTSTIADISAVMPALGSATFANRFDQKTITGTTSPMTTSPAQKTSDNPPLNISPAASLPNCDDVDAVRMRNPTSKSWNRRSTALTLLSEESPSLAPESETTRDMAAMPAMRDAIMNTGITAPFDQRGLASVAILRATAV